MCLFLSYLKSYEEVIFYQTRSPDSCCVLKMHTPVKALVKAVLKALFI